MRQPSNTALAVASLRVVHQLFDAEPRVLEDPVIPRLLGAAAVERIRAGLDRLQTPGARMLRAHVVLRSRYAEDCLARAAATGVEQYVIVGAGLDTFAYRQPSWSEQLTIIEVDHPASQHAKRARLADADIQIPANVCFAGIDFEQESLADGLRRCGVALDRRTLFSWLGVTMYLTHDAVTAVLATVAAFPPGSEIVLTFAQPNENGDAGPSPLARMAAEAGEPWLSYFTPAEITALLRVSGFSTTELLSREEAVRRYFTDRADDMVEPRRVSIARGVV